jgi:two-component system response regulator DesR
MIGSYSIEAGRSLTPRMRDVLRSAAAGASVGETAGELRISEGTVRTLRAALLARLDVRNMTAAVDEARRRGEL